MTTRNRDEKPKKGEEEEKRQSSKGGPPCPDPPPLTLSRQTPLKPSQHHLRRLVNPVHQKFGANKLIGGSNALPGVSGVELPIWENSHVQPCLSFNLPAF